MADSISPLTREQARRWTENWRRVNDLQDDLIRSGSVPDAAVSLESAFSLMAFARGLQQAAPQSVAERDAEDEPVRRTWCRLRAAYVR